MPAATDIDVFVSYTRSDQAVVARLVVALRAAGLRVWSDSGIAAGDEWRAAIVDALGRSKLLLLVHSRRAEQSIEVAKEIAVAASIERPIVPLRIEDAVPRGALLYEMARLNWVDAVPPDDSRLNEVALALVGLLRNGAGPDARRHFDEAVGARRFSAPAMRRLLTDPLALGGAWLASTLVLMVVYVRLTDFMATQLDAGVSMARSLVLLLELTTVGTPMLILGALARQPDAATLPLAVTAVVDLLLMLAWLRCVGRRAWLRWSVARAGRRTALPS